MKPSRKHLILGAVATTVLTTAALGSTVGAAEPASVDWRPAVNVRTVDEIELHDADFSNRNVAVTWQEPGSGAPRVGFRRSVDGGNGFGPLDFIPAARQSAVDICGASGLSAVWATRFGPGDWDIEYGSDSIDGTGFFVTDVATTPNVERFPDVACAGQRVFVSWLERDDGLDRLKVAHALQVDGDFGAPMNLGVDDSTFFGHSLAVAGVNDMAYVAFSRSDGDLRLKRFEVSGAPGFPVTPLPTQMIANGTPNNSADDVVIAAAGDKVALAWVRCGGIDTRVSNDQGQTWGPIRRVVDHAACGGDFIAHQRSIAIRGDRIALAYIAFGIIGDGDVSLITTTTDFASFSDDVIRPSADDEHLVGFVRAAGTTKLAAAFDPGDRVRYRRQQ